MDLFFGFVLLLLAAGMVALFAMVGELASRVGDPAATSPQTEPVAGARLGHTPATWPAGLETIGTADTAVLLVLSTVCSACQAVARQLGEQREALTDRPWGIVITCGEAENGRQFVRYHGLGWAPHFVDVNGDWTRAEFGIGSSPTGVLLSHATVQAAYAFDDVPALNAITARTFSGHRHEEVPS